MHCFPCSDYNCCDSAGFAQDVETIRATLQTAQSQGATPTPAKSQGNETVRVTQLQWKILREIKDTVAEYSPKHASDIEMWIYAVRDSLDAKRNLPAPSDDRTAMEDEGE